VRRYAQAVSDNNATMIKLSSGRLIKLFERMSVCEALDAETRSQANQLLAIVAAEDHDVNVVRAALDAVENKKAKGILFTFQALGKQLLVSVRQNLSETSSDETLHAVVAHLKDLTVALKVTSLSEGGWLTTAKTMLENIGQIGRVGSRSLKHRVREDVREAGLVLQEGVAKVGENCLISLERDIAGRLCTISVTEKDYDGLVKFMADSVDTVQPLDKSWMILATQMDSDISEPLLATMAIPFMADEGDIACWKLLSKAATANEKKYAAWSSLTEAAGTGISHAQMQCLASVYNTFGYDAQSARLQAFLLFCVCVFHFRIQCNHIAQSLMCCLSNCRLQSRMFWFHTSRMSRKRTWTKPCQNLQAN
jgi:hypothetical protein